MKYCIIKITPEDLEGGVFSYIDITKENLLCVKNRLKEAVEAYNNIIQYAPVLLCSENGRGLYELMEDNSSEYPLFILNKETYGKHCLLNKLEELATEIAEGTGYLPHVDDLMKITVKVHYDMHGGMAGVDKAVYDCNITDKVKEIATELIHKGKKQYYQKHENNKGTTTEDGSGDCQG